MLHLYPLVYKDGSPAAECGATGLRHASLVEELKYANCLACLAAAACLLTPLA